MRILFLILFAGLAATTQSGGVIAVSPSIVDERPLVRHLDTVSSQMDRGMRSREFQESLDFLRAHADEAVAELSGSLLQQPGSFRKWQLAYLVGEFGDESAFAVLRELIDEPLPPAQPAREGKHELDLTYTEDVASRVQAVMSIARIASHRPALRDQVVSELVAAGREVPLVKSTALFELRKLLGPDFHALRGYFGPEDASHFETFMPPPEWQALLLRRMHEHRRQERELCQEGEPLCLRD